MMHRTVSPNLYMEAKAGAWDGGSEDDHGHGPRDDPPRSAHRGPARNAPGEPRGGRRPDPRTFGARRGSARARKPEGVETVPRADHPQPDGCRPDRLSHARRALHGRLPWDD